MEYTKHKTHRIDDQTMQQFTTALKMQERSGATISKYERDVTAFRKWIGEDTLFGKEQVMQYKEELQERYAPNSTNSILSALNTFFRMMDWNDCRISILNVPRASFRTSERNLSADEFNRLLKAARDKGMDQLLHIMETIASTGIRIGELPYITVESLSTRRVVITLKRKTREVLLSIPLCKMLREWCRRKGISSGTIFVTRNGRPLDRSNILHMMKSIAEAAGVLRSKVFPHNLRHLFAVNYYEQEKDIVRLADLLGHSDVNTTRLYTMTTCEKELYALNKVGEAFILGS